MVVLALTFTIGLGTAIAAPTWAALQPSLAPRQFVGRAIALNGLTFNVAQATGPALLAWKAPAPASRPRSPSDSHSASAFGASTVWSKVKSREARRRVGHGRRGRPAHRRTGDRVLARALAPRPDGRGRAAASGHRPADSQHLYFLPLMLASLMEAQRVREQAPLPTERGVSR
ncbi:MFS transporter [Streptomyces sp. FR-108]|uniref:MFS transporter n=1 Tax=Streptomyces sp. FR-108 TaxID=3416665 RepID=UPI003CF2CAF5